MTQIEVEDIADKDSLNGLKESPKAAPWLTNFLVAALGGALYGFDAGAAGSVISVLVSTGDLGVLTPFQLGCVASGSLLGAVVASGILIGVGDDHVGRVWELRIASGIYIAGTAVQCVAPNLSVLLLGRVLYGLGIGTAMQVAPLYIAETVPASIRGSLVSMMEVSIMSGLLLGYTAGYLTSEWRIIFAAASVFALPMLVLAFLAPESPRWLVRQDRSEEAVDVLVQCQGVDRAEAEQQVREMEEFAQADAEPASLLGRLKRLVETPANRQAMTVVTTIVVLQQLSGQTSVLYYIGTIFGNTSFGSEVAIGAAAFKVLMTLVCVALVEEPRCGRRPLLLAGTSGMAISAAALSAICFTAGSALPISLSSVTCLLGFLGFWQIGFGPLAWLLISEVFPLRIRASAVSAAVTINFGANFLMTLVFDSELAFFGDAIVFLQCSAVCAIAVGYVACYVPETRGMSLEEIEAQLLKDTEDADQCCADA